MADSKLKLDPSLLTPRDMKRARVVLEGRNPYDLLSDPVEAPTLVIWCLRSREDPAFTWDQAEDTPFGEFDMPDMDEQQDEREGEGSPPPTAGLEPSGIELGTHEAKPAAATGNGSKRKRSSATSSA